MPLTEKRLIARIRQRAGSPLRGPGIGDDCAVLRVPRGHEVLVTTDFSLEGIHFRRDWHPAISVGHRCLARGLSDIAAMGGIPIAAFLSLALPSDLPQSWVDNFIKGVLRLAAKFDVALAGGDTAKSPKGISADIVVVGSVPKGKAILRSGAKPGDRIYVTGTLGGSAAALDPLFAGKKLRPTDFSRHFYPEPRIAVGKYLREKKLANAMIDTSDGLSTDLAHICKESKVGAEIFEGKLPRACVGRSNAAVPVKLALNSGEDYELLFTASSSKKISSKIAGVEITEIGRIISGKQMFLVSVGGAKSKLLPQGWEHFSIKK